MGDKTFSEPFLTLASTAEYEFTEKKSRFIALASPAQNEGAALGFLARARAQHKGADHHVYAYQIGAQDEIQRSNDDGEPANTAGRMLLQAIRNAGLKNTALVVARYFGGVLLGMGGLTRAYAKAAAGVLAAAEQAEQIPAAGFQLTFAYPLLRETENFLRQEGIACDEKIFAAEVALFCRVSKAAAGDFQAKIEDLAQGGVNILLLTPDAVLLKPWIKNR
ncbi:MAG: YigZ family protein [Clostridiales bacterium]|nr:YigZ family protein [Clostridiales bacterium]